MEVSLTSSDYEDTIDNHRKCASNIEEDFIVNTGWSWIDILQEDVIDNDRGNVIDISQEVVDNIRESVMDTPQEDIIDSDRGSIIQPLDVPEVGCLYVE